MLLVDEEPEDEELQDAWGDVDGRSIDVKLVRAARKEEMEFAKKIPVYEEVELEECWNRMGKPPISTKWVDHDKGRGGETDVRSRWVARDFKGKGDKDREDLFAGMPPLEAKKALFKMAAARMKGKGTRRGKKMKIMFIDVRKAHLNGVCNEEVYVELPEEAEAPGKCGKLKRWLYGMRGAAQGWERNYTEKFEGEGLKSGKSTTAVFYNEQTETRVVVHGDDFTFLGYEDELQKIKKKMEEWYEIKLRGVLGDDPWDVKEMTILNRKVTWDGEKIVCRADDKHAKIIIEEMGLDMKSKGLSSPIVKEEDDQEEGEELSREESKHFRRVTARANYLGQDRMDLQYAVKEISREMSRPTTKGMKKLKRLARYLVEVPEVEIVFRADGEEDWMDAYSDSDWAGCKSTRKSTSGGLLCWGGCLMKSWARTQASLALSVGEAEYYATVSAAAEALGFRSLMKDLGIDLKIRIWTDSSAAKSIASRTGLGKLRHLDVRILWVQKKVREHELYMKKVKGLENPADLMTKPKDIKEGQRLANLVNVKLLKDQ